MTHSTIAQSVTSQPVGQLPLGLSMLAHSVPPQVLDLIRAGATFVINHSAGKDSQAMAIYLRALGIPDAQLLVVHAHLPEVDWPDTIEHIQATVGDLPIEVCQSRRKLLDMVRERGMFPSPTLRQCTSDLKRGPIERTIRQFCRRTGQRLIVNCMGMRAEESSDRAKLTTFKRNSRNSVAGRDWYDWLPIHHLRIAEVLGLIRGAGQEPHWAYAAGMSRLSCCFCIMASQADLTTAARLQPVLYQRYVELEREIGQTMIMPDKRRGRRFLPDITGIAA